MRAPQLLALTVIFSSVAWAGRGATTASINQAIASGSTDAIVAEIERAEFLPCTGCINSVLGLVDNSSYKVREAAGWWLGRRAVRDEVLDMATSRLAVGATDAVWARNISDALAGMRELRALPLLATYLQNPLDEESGIAAARAVGAIGSPDGVAALRNGLGSTFVGVRAQALAAMRQLRAPAGVRAFTAANVMPLLSDADATVRREATMTLGSLRDASAIASLTGALQDSAPMVRKGAAWALGQIGSAQAAQALTQAQNDADPFVRSVATAALGRLR
jgi:HEAT repeat protein